MPIVRILAVDFGSKRVGLALTDPLGYTVQPLPYLTHASKDDFLNKLKTLAQEKGVQRIVLGLPRSLDGSIGPKALECQKLAVNIEKFCSVPVTLQDESFTTREAEDILIRDLGMSRKKRKEAKDSMAAVLILQSYLSSL